MPGDTCRCSQACYLTDYGRQSWTSSNPLRSRLVWHRGLITMDPGFRIGRRSRRAWPIWISSFSTQGASLVAALTLLLLATASVSWIWHVSQQEPEVDYSEYYEPEAKLTRILRSLNSRNSKQERHLTEKRDINSRNNVTILYPWLRHNNALPNYFFGGGVQSAQNYAKSPVVFIRHEHYHQDTSLVSCLREISRSTQGYSLSEWDEYSVTSPEAEVDRRKLYAGRFAFGLCDTVQDVRCSYASVFEEPIREAVSSYRDCLRGATGRPKDELCRMLDVSDVSLRDWILLRGSTTFQRLAFDAPWCRQFGTPAGNYTPDGSVLTVAPPGEWPCWLKRRWYVDRLAASGRRAQILDYVLDHLNRWLAVVGLADDWPSTIGIFEHVFRLPLSRCGANLTSLPSPEIEHYHHNKANSETELRGYYDENDPDYLRYDYSVRKALDADFSIYKKAKQIFSVQRQMIFNKINR